jgi:hypothetical protein
MARELFHFDARAAQAWTAVPNERNLQFVLEFDAATDSSATFRGRIPSTYAGGGITVVLVWAAATATTGSVRWDVSFEAQVAQDIDSDGFATAVSATSAATNGTSGIETLTSIALTNGAQIDSVAAGGVFRVRINRDADHANDDMAGLAQLISVYGYETGT